MIEIEILPHSTETPNPNLTSPTAASAASPLSADSRASSRHKAIRTGSLGISSIDIPIIDPDYKEQFSLFDNLMNKLFDYASGNIPKSERELDRQCRELITQLENCYQTKGLFTPEESEMNKIERLTRKPIQYGSYVLFFVVLFQSSSVCAQLIETAGDFFKKNKNYKNNPEYCENEDNSFIDYAVFGSRLLSVALGLISSCLASLMLSKAYALNSIESQETKIKRRGGLQKFSQDIISTLISKLLKDSSLQIDENITSLSDYYSLRNWLSGNWSKICKSKLLDQILNVKDGGIEDKSKKEKIVNAIFCGLTLLLVNQRLLDESSPTNNEDKLNHLKSVIDQILQPIAKICGISQPKYIRNISLIPSDDLIMAIRQYDPRLLIAAAVAMHSASKFLLQRCDSWADIESDNAEKNLKFYCDVTNEEKTKLIDHLYGNTRFDPKISAQEKECFLNFSNHACIIAKAIDDNINAYDPRYLSEDRPFSLAFNRGGKSLFEMVETKGNLIEALTNGNEQQWQDSITKINKISETYQEYKYKSIIGLAGRFNYEICKKYGEELGVLCELLPKVNFNETYISIVGNRSNEMSQDGDKAAAEVFVNIVTPSPQSPIASNVVGGMRYKSGAYI